VNFFEHQDRAKRQTRWLVFAFVLAALGVIAVIDSLVYVFFSGTEGRTLAEALPVLALSSLGTAGLISVSSLYRTISLRGGGAKVALEMGGVPVGADERDPLRRRLRNVVEEISLASGVPVPDIYVLEQESGINAFAAGFTPATAAVAVTRGTLEKLNREELQGVIAHEFSHILNGDMRLNIRMIGVLFGIMVIALIGRQIYYSGLHSRRFRSSDRDNGMGNLAIGLGVMAAGYMGLFLTRLIKASISRKREYLADASAVQFTRNPEGIGGALKRIAIDDVGVAMGAEVEEYSHMMFGAESFTQMFATHPPILDRIRRVEPGFHEEELEQLRANTLKRQASIDKASEQEMHREKQSKASGTGFDFGNIVDQIANPSQNHIFLATVIAASISEDLHSAARSTEWAREVVYLLLLDDDETIREHQKLMIAKNMGGQSLQHVEHLEAMAKGLLKEHRLPLAEIAFPALKRRPPEDIEILKKTINDLIQADGVVDVFEYALAKMLQQFLNETLYPARSSIHGEKNIEDVQAEISILMVTIAKLGHQDSASRTEAANVGAAELGIDMLVSTDDNWRKHLDTAIPTLDRLNPKAKERLVKALLKTIAHDNVVTHEESEVLRVICSCIHVPLPITSPA
jgi:Zn-dependent protease with chaperone function